MKETEEDIFKWGLPLFKDKNIEIAFNNRSSKAANDISKYLKIILLAAILDIIVLIITDIVNFKTDLASYSWLKISISVTAICLFAIIIIFKKYCPSKIELAGTISAFLFYVVITEQFLMLWGPLKTYINFSIVHILLLALCLELYSSFKLVIISIFCGIAYITFRFYFALPVEVYDLFRFNLEIYTYFLFVYFIVLTSKKRQFYLMYINKKTQESWKEAMEIIPEGIIIVSAENKIEFCNDQGIENLGINKQNFCDANKLELEVARICEENELFNKRKYKVSVRHGLLERSLTIKQPLFEATSLEYNHFNISIETDPPREMKRNFEEKRLLAVQKELFFNSKLSTLILLKNINEIIELERIRAENKYKTMLVATVTHELRTPVTGIKYMLDLTEQKLTDLPELLENISIAKASCDLLTNLINDILDFAKMDFNKSIFDIRETLQYVEAIIKQSTTVKGINFRIKLDENLPSIIYGDQRRVKQILLNLLTNAVKFTFRGGIILEVCTEIVDSVQIFICTVIDTGLGISKDNINKLFKPFSMLNQHNNVNPSGTGLGLNLCEQLVKKMGGEIKCQSELGKGSEFSFWIPIEDKIKRVESISNISFNFESEVISCTNVAFPQHEIFTFETEINQLSLLHTTQTMIEEESKTFSIKEKEQPIVFKILIIEDDPFILMAMGKMLDSLNVQPTKCQNGIQALEIMRQNTMIFDAIFTDIEMPMMDGFETAIAIRAHWELLNLQQIPIIAFTAHTPDGELRRNALMRE